MLANIWLVWVLFGITACKVEDCFHSTGEESTDVRTFSQPFSEISLADNIDLILIQDSVEWIKVRAGSHVIQNIQTDIKNNRLNIKNANECNIVRDYKRKVSVEVHFIQLKHLIQESIGEISNQDTLQINHLKIEIFQTGTLRLNLICSELEIYHRSAADVWLMGYAAQMNAHLYDLGGMDARNFQSDYTFLWDYSSQDVHVKPLKGLGLNLYNRGNVISYLHPIEFLNYDKQGDGKLIFK